MLRALLITLALLVVPASAEAQTVDPETQANFDRAAAYWGEETLLCSPSEHPKVIVDQTVVAPNAALAQQGTCNIWVGDFYLSTSPARRCAIIVHEWGHLTGHHDGMGQPGDPLNVMGSDAMPPSCAALDPPAAVLVAAATPPSSDPTATAMNVAYVKWAKRARARANCTATASQKRHRPARVAARQKCVRRYGRILRAPGT